MPENEYGHSTLQRAKLYKQFLDRILCHNYNNKRIFCRIISLKPTKNIMNILKRKRKDSQMNKIGLTATAFVLIFILQSAANAASPTITGTIENGTLTITVDGISARSYPQIIVLSKNSSNSQDFYLDTINLESGQKSVTHNNVSGNLYILSGIIKNKDGTDNSTIYGTAQAAVSKTVKNSAAGQRSSKKSGAGAASNAESTSQNNNLSESTKPSTTSGTHTENTISSANASGKPASQSGTLSFTDDANGYSGQNGIALPIIIISAILIGTSALFAWKFSENDK